VSGPRIRFACADYPRVMPLATGEIVPDGFSLEMITGRGGSWPLRADLLRRVLSDPDIDGGESSIGGHLRRVDEGDDRFVALPIFILRGFAGRDLYVRKDGPVKRPSDLIGKRVGLYSWVASGSVWYRHFMVHVGVPLDAVEWWVGDIEGAGETSHVVTLPPDVNPVAPGRFLAEMLTSGEIDAMWSPPRPRLFHPSHGPLVRLFADYRAADMAYFAATRVFPPLHLVVLRRAVWENSPWVARALTDAFDRSNAAFAASQRGFPYATPWLETELDEVTALMGADFYSNGLEASQTCMQAFNDQAYAAGIIRRRVPVAECFAPFLQS
jgi:4,5-dihydroxyphthalate decarboxylase